MSTHTLVAAAIFLLSGPRWSLAVPTSSSSSPAAAGSPAQPCVPDHCQLPDCRCAGMDVPGGLSPGNVPQIVLFSFDDGLRRQDYDGFYANIFNGRKNPNGCQIGLTFFVSHYYTDYAVVEDVHTSYGYEMADHTVDHNTSSSTSEEDWTGEIMEMKEMLTIWGNIAPDLVLGFRAPFLATNEAEIQVLYDNKFLYEASMSTNTMYWPFTLDYKSPLCNAPATCPVNSYPGLWIVPVINLQQKNGFPCEMLDACTDPQTSQDWLDLLTNNFNAHYNGNRAPFGIYAHSAWLLKTEGSAAILNGFLDQLAKMPDVYVVTHQQMLDWVRNPTPLDQILRFGPWSCSNPPQPRCDYHAPGCYHWYQDWGQTLSTCTTPCPPNFPHYGDPYGN